MSYESTKVDGGRFRSTEVLTCAGDEITRVEAYFGWNLGGAPALGAATVGSRVVHDDEEQVAAFDAIAEELLPEHDVEEGTGFGSNPGLRVRGKIFAMLVRGELVVKLPAERCAALIDAGGARSFEVGRRRMREWVSVEPGAHDWPALAREALAFVGR